MTWGSRGVGRWMVVLLLGAVFVAEFLLFDRVGAHRITWLYPRWNDQVQYLSECYTGYEFARTHGFFAGLWHTLVNPSAQGTLHDFAALLLFKVVGPSRSAALALNMLALVAWQVSLFAVVARSARSLALGACAAMLPLVLQGPWLAVPGSAYDFRLDHLAMCALGVTSAVAVATGGFQRRGASIAFGVMTGITLLTRFITGTYFVVVFVTFAAWALIQGDRPRRMMNLGLAALIAAAMAGPIFWLNREWVWNYYYIGHYVGPESAIRNQNFGVGRSLAYVFGWLETRHLGTFFGIFAAAVAAALGAARIFTRTGPTAARSAGVVPVAGAAASGESRNPCAGFAACGVVFLLAPALVLTLHPQKSEVVLSALVPGVILLVIACWQVLLLGWRHDAVPDDAPAATPRPRSTGWIAVGAALIALAVFAHRQRVEFETPATIDRLRQVNTIADYIADHSVAARLDHPRIACDHITDAIDAQVLRVVVYERRHVWMDFDMTLPTGIAEPAAELVRQRVETSDFVFLAADDQPVGHYPFDHKMDELRPSLRRWCETHLHPALRFPLDEHPMVLWEKAH